MIDDRKIKKITGYFSRKRDVEKKQLATFREQSGAVAGLNSVKPFASETLSESAKNSLVKKSEQSKIPFYVLREVYKRGFFAWKISEQKTPQQLGFERVNSFIAQGQTFFNDDKDLSEKVSVRNEFKTSGIKNKKLSEDLRKWFSKSHPEGGWKRINSKGEVVGPCAREPGEPKPKCMSNEKRAKLTKKQRASAVAAKRKHDPVADRSGKGGKPINVSNFGKGNISK